jgi:hypothetical protein
MYERHYDTTNTHVVRDIRTGLDAQQAPSDMPAPNHLQPTPPPYRPSSGWVGLRTRLRAHRQIRTTSRSRLGPNLV